MIFPFSKNIILVFNFSTILIYIIIGYIFGSIPVGYLFAKSKGVNIFEVGSKNPGSTNIGRIFGKTSGRIVFFLDVLKTVFPIILCSFTYYYFINKYLLGDVNYLHYNIMNVFSDPLSSTLLSKELMYGNIRAIKLIVGLGVILGHNFSIFTHFRGGKGITVTVGTIFCFNVYFAIILYLVYWIVKKITGFVSVGSITALIIMAISAFILTGLHIYPFALKYSEICPFFTLIYAIIGILRHKSNIIKLINGTENKAK